MFQILASKYETQCLNFSSQIQLLISVPKSQCTEKASYMFSKIFLHVLMIKTWVRGLEFKKLYKMKNLI